MVTRFLTVTESTEVTKYLGPTDDSGAPEMKANLLIQQTGFASGTPLLDIEQYNALKKN